MGASGWGLARVAVGSGCAAAAAAIAGPLLAYLEWVAPMTGFGLFVLALLLAVVALFAGSAALVTGPSGARSKSLLGLVPAVVILIAVSTQVVPTRDYPRINDITTDTERPPEFVAARDLAPNRSRDMAYAGEEFARQQRAAYPDLAPVELSSPPEASFAQVRRTAEQMPGWQITLADPDAHRIEGIETSRLFRFRDDFVIEVRGAGTGSVVHMRSKSRDGRGDLGVNAKRIRTFFAKLREAGPIGGN